MTAGQPGEAARRTPHTDDRSPASAPSAAAHRWPLLAWAAVGALLILLLSQLPVAHDVNIGGRDAAYVQGFHEPERPDSPALAGSDGAARWSQPSAALRFPQAGLPGEVALRLRGLREDGPPPEITLLLNGTTVLDRFQSTGDWEERRLAITGGWLKASDFFVEIRAAPTTLADGREVGALLDRATYSVGPGLVAPYPSQLAYGALVGLLLAALASAGRRTLTPPRPRSPNLRIAAGLLLYGLAWLLLYRMPPPLYPHPLGALPPLTVLALAATLAVREGPALAARAPWLVGVAAPAAVIGGWTVATLVVGQGHLTLSRPGVENDFRVFATRETLAQVFSADGFYNLGYPLLLWLVRPLFDGNAFLAGRLIAALAGAVLLGASYWLARALLPPGPALAALITLALSGLVAQYGLYVGSDMPFAACVALCAAAVAWAGRRGEAARRRADDRGLLALAALAGIFGGLAFLVRHLGLVLLPWGALALLVVAVVARRQAPAAHARRGRALLAPAIYSLAFLLTIAPQLAINTLQAGQPLYNQQAKNIWLAVYGGTDWGRWEEAPNTIGLAEVVLRDPARFLENWWRNVIGYTGSGAEDTSEFGRALQLRLLGWPANWLAVAGLLAWLLLTLRALATALTPSHPHALTPSHHPSRTSCSSSSPPTSRR